jgi:hypothetical protein
MKYKEWVDLHFEARPIWWAVLVVLLMLVLGAIGHAQAGSGDHRITAFCMHHIQVAQSAVAQPGATAESEKERFKEFLLTDPSPHVFYKKAGVVAWVNSLLDRSFEKGGELDVGEELRTCVAAILEKTGRLIDTASSEALLYTPICEARVIAEHSRALNEKEWLEVVQLAREIGRIDAEHAERLMELIREVYSTVDRAAWAKAKCQERRL